MTGIDKIIQSLEQHSDKWELVTDNEDEHALAIWIDHGNRSVQVALYFSLDKIDPGKSGHSMLFVNKLQVALTVNEAMQLGDAAAVALAKIQAKQQQDMRNLLDCLEFPA